MSFQAYLDNIQAKTGTTPADFARLAVEKRLTKHGEIVAWLKADFGLGHGHCQAIAAVLLKSESRKAPQDEKLDKLFAGKKAAWRPTYDAIATAVKAFGADVNWAANETYVNWLVNKKKFAIVQPASGERLEIGIKLRGVPAQGRLEESGSWNPTVTHKVSIRAASEVDAEVLAWLQRAYQAAV